MKLFIKLLATIIVITYSLKLVNSQSDLLVFSGLAIIGAAIYVLITDLNHFLETLNSKI